MNRSLVELRLVVRSLLVQASWNYRTLNGSGVIWALMPGISHRVDSEWVGDWPDPEQPLNSHPYLSPFMVGALIRACENGEDAEALRRLGTALRSPLGALGDDLVWGAWRPSCLLGGILLAFLGAPPVAIAGGLLVVYNLLQAILRLWGIRAGMSRSETVTEALRRARLAERTGWVQTVGTLILGLLAGFLLMSGLTQENAGGPGTLWMVWGTTFAAFGFFAREGGRRWAPTLLLFIVLLGFGTALLAGGSQ